MSLINQVLNDLEKRGVNPAIGEATVRVVPYRSSRRVLWWALGSLSLLVLGAVAWMEWGAAPLLDLEASVSVAEVAASQPLASDNLAVASQPLAVTVQAAEQQDQVPVAQPLLILPPVIAAVSPAPLVATGMSQTLTISGGHFNQDASVILRTPKGKAYAKRQIVQQDAEKIVISANFGSKAGKWSVVVENPGGRNTEPYMFEVQAAPQALVQTEQKAQTVDKPVPPEKPASKPEVAESRVEAVVAAPGKISKKVTQITPQQQAENEYLRAYGLLQQGQMEAAISGFEAALQLDAGHTQARQTLVRLLLDSRRGADAERVLQQGLEHDPKQSSFAMLLARMHVARNELEAALEVMQKSLPYAAKDAEFLGFVAALVQRMNKHSDAIEYYTRALRLRPRHAVWLMGLGISLRAEQRNDEAREAFNKALEQNTLSSELKAFVTQQLKEF